MLIGTGGFNKTLTTFAKYFGNEELTQPYSIDKRIAIVDDEINSKHIQEYERLVIEFREIVESANNPIKCCKYRCNCFGLKTVNLFHSNDHLEEMLEINFDGRKFDVKA